MAGKRWKLSAMWVASEAGSFATDPSANGSGYAHIKVLPDATFEPTQEVVDRPGQVNDLVRQAHAMGAKGGKISFKTEAKGSGTPAADNTIATLAESAVLLKALFGTETKGTGSIVVAAGSTTTVINVTPGDGVGFSKYMMVIFDCGATYGKVIRFITSIATDALTLDRALPTVPANGAAVYASTMYTRANSGHISVAFVAKRGEATSIEYTFLGCKIDSVKLSGIGAGGTAILEWTFSVTDWSATTKGSLPATVLTGITATKAPVIKGSCFAVGGTEELIYDLALDFNHKFEFQDATCALGTSQPDSINAGLELVDASPGGNIKSYFKTQHKTDFFAGTENAIAFGALTQATPANAFGFYVPKAQYTAAGFEEHKGLVGENLPFMVNDNSTDAEYSFCVA